MDRCATMTGSSPSGVDAEKYWETKNSVIAAYTVLPGRGKILTFLTSPFFPTQLSDRSAPRASHGTDTRQLHAATKEAGARVRRGVDRHDVII